MVLTGLLPQHGQWKCLKAPTMSQVKGITIGSLFQSSKASLTTPFKASSQDAQHASPPPPLIRPPASPPEGGTTSQDLQFGPLPFSPPPT